MTPGELADIWRRLPTPTAAEQMEARRLPDSRDSWAALDAEGRRHLLLEVEPGVVTDLASTKGMTVVVARHQVAGNEPASFLDLVCMDESVVPTFTAVACDIGNAVVGVAPAGRPAVVREAMAHWQWFWDLDSDQLSANDALGLFGELWFLHRWIGTTEAAVAGWTASEGSRHDFQWPDLSVEVKVTATRRDGGVVHRIAHLDQLAPPETGELLLFSLRVSVDQLAANSLPILVDAIAAALRQNPMAERTFREKLSQRGYNPALRHRHDTTYRIGEERLYRVEAGFPRLTAESFAEGVPAGVDGIAYSLAMEACASWLLATRREEWVPPSA